MTLTKTITLYGPRATGITIAGQLHADETTTLAAQWYTDMDDAENDISETAEMCGCDPNQSFELIQIDLDLPSWWDTLDEDLQDTVISQMLDRIEEYPSGYTTICEWTGDEFASD